MNDFLKSIKVDKTEINWNKNPIKMDLFLSFLTIQTVKCKGHLGESNGWTRYEGSEGLIICGGIVGRCEYLDAIQYKEKLNNPYNNYVSPFYLFEIMTDEGKRFFINYFADEILEIKNKVKSDINLAKERLKKLEKYKDDTLNFWSGLERLGL